MLSGTLILPYTVLYDFYSSVWEFFRQFLAGTRLPCRCHIERTAKTRLRLNAQPGFPHIKQKLLVLILNVLVHRSRGALACAHCEDNGSRTGNSVAAGEYAVLGGDAVLVVSHDAALAVGIQTRSRVTDQRVRAGANRRDDAIEVEHKLAAFDRNRTAAAGCVTT